MQQFVVTMVPSVTKNTVECPVDQMQLAILCKEVYFKQFGQEMVSRKLVDDLKELEDNGIIVNGKHFQCRLAVISGDNLGSHGIGGFTENFSSAQFLCRFCLIERKNLTSSEIMAKKT